MKLVTRKNGEPPSIHAGAWLPPPACSTHALPCAAACFTGGFAIFFNLLTSSHTLNSHTYEYMFMHVLSAATRSAKCPAPGRGWLCVN